MELYSDEARASDRIGNHFFHTRADPSVILHGLGLAVAPSSWPRHGCRVVMGTWFGFVGISAGVV